MCMERNERVHDAWMNGAWTSKNKRVRVHVWKESGGYVESFGEKSFSF